MSPIPALSIATGVLLVCLLLLLVALQRTRRSMTRLQLELQQRTLQLASASEGAHRDLSAIGQSMQLREAAHARELARVQQELDALSYSVSHDLAAPARKIHGFADLLRSEASALNEEGCNWLARIEHNSRQLGEMIAELLRFSRIGQATLDLRTVDLAPLVAEVVRAAGTAYPNTQVQIAHLPAVRCDPGLMRQVFQSLVANAFKFSAGNSAPRIEIGVQSGDAAATGDEDGTPRFFVRDNGAGFNPRHADKLFGMFQRLHKESEFPGAGTGLAIARHIVSRHEGRIWAESAPAEGATFYFTIGCADRPVREKV
jgi:light-regulated signal transduction histidine kinase (bacteriophytochrome)